MLDFDPTGAGATLTRLAASGGDAGTLAKQSAQQKKLQEKAYQVSEQERNAGLISPTRTIGSDPEFRKCRFEALWGYQPIQRGVGGNEASVMGDLAINLGNSHFPIPGSVAIMERANAHAGGTMVLKTDQSSSTPPPKVTITGGGCGDLPQTDLQGRFFYRLMVVRVSDGKLVGYSGFTNYILTAPECVDAYLAAFPPDLEGGTYASPALTRVEYQPGATGWTVFNC